MLFSGVLILGGRNYSGDKEILNSMAYFSPENLEGARIQIAEQTMTNRRFGHVSALLPKGRVLTAVGLDKDENYLLSSELFHTRTGQVKAGPNMAERRLWAAAAVVADSVYVCGGMNGFMYSLTILSSCEQFHSDKWTAVTSMAEKRQSLAMAAVDGRLYAIGGYNGKGQRRFDGQLSSVERFDPKSNRWEPVSPMDSRRRAHAAAVLNGYIYVCGWTVAAERYDPQNDQWEGAGKVMKIRINLSFVAMNGYLYVLGGVGVWSEVGSFKRYDPNKDKWTLVNDTYFKFFENLSAVAL